MGRGGSEGSRARALSQTHARQRERQTDRQDRHTAFLPPARPSGVTPILCLPLRGLLVPPRPRGSRLSFRFASARPAEASLPGHH